jgi:phage tail-like protein
MAEQNLLKVSNFVLEIDGLIVAGFSEATIPESTLQVIKYRNGNDPSIMSNIVGLHEVGPLILKKGVTFDEPSSLELSNWHKDVVEGKLETSKKNISVIMIAQDGFTEGARFNVVDGIPTKYTISPLNSKNNEVVIESLEIQNKGVTRVS